MRMTTQVTTAAMVATEVTDVCSTAEGSLTTVISYSRRGHRMGIPGAE